jgi:hypothetical protein
MTITPVLESYLSTLEEADALALKRLNSSAWAGANKATALQEATRHIDQLPLRGRRYEPVYIENGVQIDADRDGLTQIMEFPRIIDGVVCDYDKGTQRPIIPALVKLACLEEAIWILQHGDTQRLENQQTGVASQSIAGSSESYVPGFGLQTLLSMRARTIMKRFVGAEIR